MFLFREKSTAGLFRAMQVRVFELVECIFNDIYPKKANHCRIPRISFFFRVAFFLSIIAKTIWPRWFIA